MARPKAMDAVTTEYRERLGAMLRRAREKRELSLRTLSRMLACKPDEACPPGKRIRYGQGYLLDLETGNANPTISYLWRLATAMKYRLVVVLVPEEELNTANEIIYNELQKNSQRRA